MKETISILHLEDNPADAELIGRALKKDGLSIFMRVAGDRDEFLALLEDIGPQLVIADYSLPSMTAMDAIEIVLEQSPGTPIIICTGSIDETTAVQCLNAGADDYVLKENLARLGSAVMGALDRKRAREEKERAEKALSEERDYVRNLIDSSLDMIIAVNGKRKITEFNPAAEAAFGYDRDEVLGKHVNQLYADSREGLAVHKKTVRDGQHVQEIMCRRKNGETFPCLLSASVLTGSDGKVVGVMGVSRDITQAKRDEEILRFQSDILSNVQDSVIVTDRERRIVYWNTGATELYGYSAEEMIGQTTAILYPKQDHGQVGKELERLKIGADLSGAWKGLHKDGSEVWVAIKTTIVSDSAGKPMGHISVSRDITRRKMAEEKLQLSDQIISHIENLVLVLDKRSRVIFAGPSIMSMLGYSIEEMLGDGWFSLAWQDDKGRERDKAYISAAIQGETQIRTEPYERQIYGKGGEPHWILWQDALGPNNTLIGIGHEITEYKRLEAQLIHAEKMRAVGELAAGIAHEINSPIQYIGDNLRFMDDSHNKLGLVLEKKILPLMASKEFKMLLGDVATDETFIGEEEIKYIIEENPKAVKQSLEGVDRISEIVKAMRTFSHPGRGAKSLANINEAIQSTVMVARNEWKYVADMELDLDPDLPPIPCLVGELNQVFLNVIVNAAQAIGEVVESSTGETRGIISISTRQEGEDAVIRIGDTGPGIREEIRDRIFEPFFTTKEVGQGTGQGLSITHGVITEKHGGSIRLETELGKGTTFIIRLPLKASESLSMDQPQR